MTKNSSFSEESLSRRDIEQLIPHCKRILLDEASYSPSMPNLILARKKIDILSFFFLANFSNIGTYHNGLLLKLVAQSEHLLIRKTFPKFKKPPQIKGSSTEHPGSAFLGDTLLIDTELIPSMEVGLFVLQSRVRNQHDKLLCSSESSTLIDLELQA